MRWTIVRFALTLGMTMLCLAGLMTLTGQQPRSQEANLQVQEQIWAEVNRYVPTIETGVPVDARCEVTAAPAIDAALDTLVETVPHYRPQEIWRRADPSNYGDRVRQDVYGRPVSESLLVVIHETVGPAEGTVHLFQTYHPYDYQQVSYHTIIDQDGTLIHTVPAKNRAYGAGNSEFQGESVKTNPEIAASVNNFAYHISLETPDDGIHEYDSHSGYTDAQYRSLAWLISRTHVAEDRVVFHKDIDRYGERNDPRSFDQALLDNYLKPYQGIRTAYCSLVAKGKGLSASKYPIELN
ncbi:peptidoglycan recognition protein family protein [Candidatus Synechococcus calcipolaris G9]|uniref:N-acetylmuramoyl-L-alanine amidase n=1 Tax=Candidatus Synechococcus calcipolaris G9 TaxID=1497997 RepID=A0ABT6EZN9_9SYNE|nr:peptidoglycan recognition family protein [Candidatus Synechococcus calcipolaris]MDG2991047.1 peptidoglycan recognition protein family protein [Candidatus Synechococcus calcipolaris G9]